MKIELSLSGRQLYITNPRDIERSDDFSYIRCDIDLQSEVFKPIDVLIAIFKSASYNIVSNVILDISYNTVDDEIVDTTCHCYVPPKVFERGGVIQMLIYKNESAPRGYAQEATNTVEFFINPQHYVPLAVPQMWEAIADDVADLRSIIAAGVDYEDIDNKPAIEGVTLIGDQTYEELNLLGLTNLEIEAMCV